MMKDGCSSQLPRSNGAKVIWVGAGTESVSKRAEERRKKKGGPCITNKQGVRPHTLARLSLFNNEASAEAREATRHPKRRGQKRV